jgi:hypothetical protein
MVLEQPQLLCVMRYVAENKTVLINRIAWANFGL